MALCVAFRILFARVLGPARYGLWAAGHSALSIARSAANAGLQNGVVRFGGVHPGVGDKARAEGTLIGSDRGVGCSSGRRWVGSVPPGRTGAEGCSRNRLRESRCVQLVSCFRSVRW